MNYLKAGRGELCAGQVRAMASPDCFLKASESTMVENLGLEDPTGSAGSALNLNWDGFMEFT